MLQANIEPRIEPPADVRVHSENVELSIRGVFNRFTTKRAIRSSRLLVVLLPRKIRLPTFRNSIEKNRCTFLEYLSGFLKFK